MSCFKSFIEGWSIYINGIIAVILAVLFLGLGITGTIKANKFDDFSSTPLWQKILLYVYGIVSFVLLLPAALPMKRDHHLHILSFIGSVIAIIVIILMIIFSAIGIAKFDMKWTADDVDKRIQIEKDNKCCIVYKWNSPDINDMEDDFIGNDQNDYIKVYENCPYVADGTLKTVPLTCLPVEKNITVCKILYYGDYYKAPYICHSISIVSDFHALLGLVIVAPISLIITIIFLIFKIFKYKMDKED